MQHTDNKQKQKNSLSLFVKWMIAVLLIGLISGTASALFLLSLDWVTAKREFNPLVIYFLPLGGLLIGLAYHYLGKEVEPANSKIVSEFKHPQKPISIFTAPLVFVGTLITHLVGGSAGREGTAVQMGAALSDRLNSLFKFSDEGRRVLLICGVASGFSSVFGTPFAGVIFAMEIFKSKKISYLIPLLFTSFLAHNTCLALGVKHTSYIIAEIPAFSLMNFVWASLAGLLFGLTANFFVKIKKGFSNFSNSKIRFAPFRPFIGGFVLLLVFGFTDSQRFMGLGIPSLQNSFSENLFIGDFMIKLVFTAFTLGFGFKGGEATPLFYIGATLGNALQFIIPLPVGLLAGMGFTAVYGAATLAPMACTIMALELFGISCGFYVLIACLMARLTAPKQGIYS